MQTLNDNMAMHEAALEEFVDAQKRNMESIPTNGLQCLITYIYLIIN